MRHGGNDLISTKERILLVAEDLFAEKGFEGARTRDIAERANVNISTLHFHWTSKEELYQAVYKCHFDRWTAAVDEIFKFLNETPTSPAEWEKKMGKVAEKLCHFFSTHPQTARLDVLWRLDAHAPDRQLNDRARHLLLSISERMGRILPKLVADQIDLELTVLTVIAFLEEHFINLGDVAEILGEVSSKTLDQRVKQHTQRMLVQLWPVSTP
jgi:AcrR family transcriptional regulator